MAEKVISMRTPFEPNHISKLPKPTKQQTEEVKANFKAGVRCEICGGWHHPKVIHLDYVGHAALTDRLLDVDPSWSWEPLSINADGLPVIDSDGGMWIKLTVAGVTRLGYGDAQGKTGGDAMKERIGDALRNAAMRFGAALDLWHKGILHLEDDDNAVTREIPKAAPKTITPTTGAWESLTTDQKTQLSDIIDGVRNEFNQKGAEAAAKLWSNETDMLEATEKVAAWNKFPSNERSAMKAASAASKKGEPA